MAPFLRSTSVCFRFLYHLKYRLQEDSFRYLLYLAAVFLGLLVGLLQTRALQTRLFDVGIFHQILWSLIHGLGFHSSISGAGNFLLDHLSPSLALLAPFFWLSGESPYFLSQVHVLLLFGGAAAWLYYAEKLPGVPRHFRPHLAAATVVFIISFDSLWGNIFVGIPRKCPQFRYTFLGSGLNLDGTLHRKNKKGRTC